MGGKRGGTWVVGGERKSRAPVCRIIQGEVIRHQIPGKIMKDEYNCYPTE